MFRMLISVYANAMYDFSISVTNYTFVLLNNWVKIRKEIVI